MTERRCLLVSIAEPISSWVGKGEVIDRYLNPGDRFTEVHVLLTNDDCPPTGALQKMVGSARVEVTNLPAGPAMFMSTLGWRPHLLKSWAQPAVDLAKQVQPALVRSFGAHLNSFAGSRASRAVGVPHLVSVHTNPDTDRGSAHLSWRLRIGEAAIKAAARQSLRTADLVLPVYPSIVPYLRRVGVRRYEVAYNVISPSTVDRKGDYTRGPRLRVVSVGRQFSEKNPVDLIRAVMNLPDVELCLIGTGESHAALRAQANGCERVQFIEAMANDAVCRMLPTFDVFAAHNLYRGIPKTVLEAALAGLPILLNRIPGPEVEELGGGLCLFVDDSVSGYSAALQQLAESQELRTRFGTRAYETARSRWGPELTEQRYVDIYEHAIASGPRA